MIKTLKNALTDCKQKVCQYKINSNFLTSENDGKSLQSINFIP